MAQRKQLNKLLGASVMLATLMLNTISIAIAQTQEQIDMVTQKLGRPQTKSSTCSYIAGACEGAGKYTTAIEYYNKMLKIYADDPGLGPECPKYWWIVTKIALCEKALGHTAAAQASCKNALSHLSNRNPREENYDADYLSGIQENCSIILGTEATLPKPSNTWTPKLQSIAASEISNLSQREKDVLEFVNSSKQKGLINSRYVAELLYLANIYTLENKYTLAEPIFKEVISMAEQSTGKNNPSLLRPLSNYGYMLKRQGRISEADTILKRMYQIAGK